MDNPEARELSPDLVVNRTGHTYGLRSRIDVPPDAPVTVVSGIGSDTQAPRREDDEEVDEQDDIFYDTITEDGDTDSLHPDHGSHSEEQGAMRNGGLLSMGQPRPQPSREYAWEGRDGPGREYDLFYSPLSAGGGLAFNGRQERRTPCPRQETAPSDVLMTSEEWETYVRLHQKLQTSNPDGLAAAPLPDETLIRANPMPLLDGGERSGRPGRPRSRFLRDAAPRELPGRNANGAGGRFSHIYIIYNISYIIYLI